MSSALAFSCALAFFHFSTAVVLYRDYNYTGPNESVSLPDSKCYNLNSEIRGKVSSVDATDHCARLYTLDNCTGAAKEIPPWAPSRDLKDWSFDDKAVSVGPCLRSCGQKGTGAKNGAPIEILVFEFPHFKGAYEEIRVVGCTRFPEYFEDRLHSIKTNGSCVKIYNNADCVHSSDSKSVELRPDIPHYDDLNQWRLFRGMKAISHCSYSCPESTIEKIDQFTLYDGTNFTGNKKNIDAVIRPERCIDIPRLWDGATKSINISGEVCLQLFDRRGCIGRSISLNSSQPDLSELDFDQVARSFRGCAPVERSQPNNENQNAGMKPGILAAVTTTPLVALCVVFSLVLFFAMKFYRRKMAGLTEKEIQEFLRGLDLSKEYVENSVQIVNPGVACDAGYSMLSVEILAQSKPYNQEIEVARSRIIFDGKSPIGVGEFGAVYKGVVVGQQGDGNKNDGSNTPVAIKTVKPGAGAFSLRSLLKEVKVMLYLGRHPHIVQMVGCCTENLRKGEILVLMEYCSNESLEAFLQKNRHSFGSNNEQRNGEVELEMNNNNYCSMEDITAIPTGASFGYFQLLQWCVEVARGMEFLAYSKVVHSDLAARNVLLTDNLQAKISDFGLSKQLYRYTLYTKKKQEPLPWRWLAIESLKNFEFSTKSDVWSYGVFCWEVFTLGETPYQGVVWSSDFISDLEAGLRLQKARYAVPECHNLMTRCWAEDPNARPSFTEIIEEMSDCFQI